MTPRTHHVASLAIVVLGAACSSSSSKQTPAGSTDAASEAASSEGLVCNDVCFPVEGRGFPEAPTAIAADSDNFYWIDSAGLMQQAQAYKAPVITLATTPTGAFALDATHVYYSGEDASDLPMIMKVAIGGGAPTTLVSDLQASLMAVQGGTLYWIGGNALLSIPVTGGTTTTLVHGSSTVAGPLLLDSENVYFTSGSSLSKVPLKGGTPTPIKFDLNGLVTSFALSNGTFYAAELEGTNTVPPPDLTAPGLAVADGTVYWTDFSVGCTGGPNCVGSRAIVSAPVTGGDTTTLVTADVTSGREGVFSVPISGGTVTTLVTYNDIGIADNLDTGASNPIPEDVTLIPGFVAFELPANKCLPKFSPCGTIAIVSRAGVE
jgi:hypothetical protein